MENAKQLEEFKKNRAKFITEKTAELFDAKLNTTGNNTGAGTAASRASGGNGGNNAASRGNSATASRGTASRSTASRGRGNNSANNSTRPTLASFVAPRVHLTAQEGRTIADQQKNLQALRMKEVNAIEKGIDRSQQFDLKGITQFHWQSLSLRTNRMA